MMALPSTMSEGGEEEEEEEEEVRVLSHPPNP